ncbi:hypothetical protein KAR91_71335 [Candidatus Pacearchaeota archaeon]|nr:hypothetical protein [Candidatus Pacearchaeota archaeon]
MLKRINDRIVELEQRITELETVLENADMLLVEIDMAAKISELQAVVNRLADPAKLYPLKSRWSLAKDYQARIEYAKQHATEES